MSFWDNNKDSIKSGSLAVLKGAGKATASVSKAGYSAYKNHGNKKTAGETDGSEEDLSTPYAGNINYKDPKSFPPPPHHVAAYGHAEANPGTPAGYPAPNSQYAPQQQYGVQQPPVQNSQSFEGYGQQPYGQAQPQQPYGYGQQPPALPTPSAQQPQPPYAYGQQLAAQQQSYAYGQQPAVQQPQQPYAYGQQQPPAPPTPPAQQPQQPYAYGQQKPPAPPTPSAQQPQQPYAYGQQPPAPPTRLTQQPQQPQQPYAYGQQQAPAPQTAPLQQPYTYGQQQSSAPPALPAQQPQQPHQDGASTPSDVLNYNNPYYQQNPEGSQPPLQQTPYNLPLRQDSYHSGVQPSYVPPANSISYPQPPARSLPSTPGISNPAPAPLHTNQSYNDTQSETNLHSAQVDKFKEKGLPGADKEVIVEPKFKTNLLDFDLSKFGAPPPKARLTKEEELKIEKRNAEKQRLNQIKEVSLQKAKEAANKNVSPYGSLTSSAITSANATQENLSSDFQKSSSEILNTATTVSNENITASRQLPALPQRNSSVIESKQEKETPQPFHLPDVSQFQPPLRAGSYESRQAPLLQHTTTCASESKIEQEAPKPFQLPDISQFQPPPLAHIKSIDSANEENKQSPTVRPSIPHQDRPLMPIPQSLPRTSSTSDYSRSPIASPSVSERPILKKAPPPKPAKLSSLELSSISHEKPKKVPPPKPTKLAPAKPMKPAAISTGHSKTPPPKPSKPSLAVAQDDISMGHHSESSARGNHIRELQAKLGNLNL